MRKLICFVIVSLAILITTTAFAESNSGNRLIDWYNYSFSVESKNVEEEFSKQMDLLNSEIEKFVSSSVEKITNDSEKYRNRSIFSTSEEMENYKENYIDRLEETKNQLLNDDFQEEKELLKEKINLEVEQDIVDILNEVLN